MPGEVFQGGGEPVVQACGPDSGSDPAQVRDGVSDLGDGLIEGGFQDPGLGRERTFEAP